MRALLGYVVPVALNNERSSATSFEPFVAAFGQPHWAFVDFSNMDLTKKSAPTPASLLRVPPSTTTRDDGAPPFASELVGDDVLSHLGVRGAQALPLRRFAIPHTDVHSPFHRLLLAAAVSSDLNIGFAASVRRLPPSRFSVPVVTEWLHGVLASNQFRELLNSDAMKPTAASVTASLSRRLQATPTPADRESADIAGDVFADVAAVLSANSICLFAIDSVTFEVTTSHIPLSSTELETATCAVVISFPGHVYEAVALCSDGQCPSDRISVSSAAPFCQVRRACYLVMLSCILRCFA